ncbi:iron-only hydrogenase system regulator [Tepiditoga spiralis]|uniref:Iron-only hydrogenase system regulator n=1 Tax=Tepiditoga spiralis TaxID=2108365 RepID=A0A7G1G373_9BACT|nr:TM1266 family iron-only hydrogenase system putative regulator [Tepiditoga spiralis]BBE30840.1 iron-only hydrogenase system regulator [Tepiditoga spiralis]
MENKVAMISIAITDRKNSYLQVNEILHNFREKINLRVGYPMTEKNVAIIFIIFEGTTDEIGALNGKLGQLNGVKVKSHTLKI